MKTIFKILLIALAAFAIGGCAVAKHAVGSGFGHKEHAHNHFTKYYDIEIVNISHGLSFTPILVASHDHHYKLFTLGQPASDALEDLAEGGATEPLKKSLMDSGKVHAVETSKGLLAPGESVTITIKTNGYHSNISLAAMMLPTNDSFMAINAVHVDTIGEVVLWAKGYDAGSEPNSNRCRSIPGPLCKGEGTDHSKKGKDNFVHIGYGLSGNDLRASHYSWNNPVAKIIIKRNFAAHKKP